MEQLPRSFRILSTSQSNQKEITVAPIVEQRKHRPIAPHLTIYQPQLTWYMSLFHRATGGALAVGKDLTWIYLGTELDRDIQRRWRHDPEI